ncbi:MAG: YafY family protein [Pseudomonadota bacterium]
MRRADRLFQIVQHLRGGRLVTAQMLAERLEVSERTIYRDIADLQSTGVPIDGEAGVGYIMRDGFDLPPLMFTRDEIVALVAGARMLRSVGGLEMARAAQEALVKIETVLPDRERERLRAVSIRVPFRKMSDDEREALDVVERASEDRHVITFDYVDAKGAKTNRRINPLGLWMWTKAWTTVGWCHDRDDFRMFRIDRMSNLHITHERFRDQPGRTLRDLYAQMREHEGLPDDFDMQSVGL